MSGQMQNLLLQYVKEVQGIYGRDLKVVILYGSYARGDFHASSDIDIMILVNSDGSVIKGKGRMLSNVTFDYYAYCKKC